MNRTLFFTFALIAGLLTVAGVQLQQVSTENVLASTTTELATEDLEAVETNMHEFMEYYFQLPFRRLEAAMRKSPGDDRQIWKAIKSDTLILAESGNLLLNRHQENADAWNDYAVGVRDNGKEMYQATLKSEFETAKEKFKAMVDQCNDCHNEFAEGKHQLRVR